MKDLTLTNYNTHDCHVMLTTSLPIAIRAINPVFLKIAVTQLCYFFNKVTQKVIDRDKLESLQEFTLERVSQFEMCFPQLFFDIMVHLVVHLVPQIQALGPMYLHEMWTYECFMAILNGYVSTHAHPEVSMVDGYCTKEAIEWRTILQWCPKRQGRNSLPPSRHEGRLHGSGKIGQKSFIPLDYNAVLEAHHSILHQLSTMEHLLDQHLNELQEHNPGQTNDWVMKEHNKQLYTWLREQDIPSRETIEEQTIKALAPGPSRQVTTWQTYDICGFTFHTKYKDKKSMTQNSGVRCDAIDDKTGDIITYFGFIEGICELDYGTF